MDKKKKHDVLIINSYAGSLVIAARDERCKIRASMEDAGYGLEIQRANFPRLRFFEKRDAWPERDDLRHTIVLAHPPCSAFSVQNASAAAKGVDAKKFQCTIDVMNYALSRRCAALAVESVPGALEGAREVHDEYAKKYGYNVFRIMQNAITFGLPQWRPRFWCLFLKKDLIEVEHRPLFRSVSTVIDTRYDEKKAVPRFVELVKQQKLRLRAMGVSRGVIESMLAGEHGHGAFQRIVQKTLGLDTWQDANKYCVAGTSFSSDSLIVLDPEGYANTVLCGSFWTYMGRPLMRKEYKRIMGFPEDYEMPGVRASKEMLCYLARGVCPPVAQFIIRTLRQALGDQRFDKGSTHAIRAGEVLDLRVKRADFSTKEQRQMRFNFV